MVESTEIVHGYVAPGYEGVREAFAATLTLEGELGAAFAAYRDGLPLVDLWGGVADADSGRAWLRDTPLVIFSGTKGLAALCLLMLVDRGELDPAAPVSAYWPEFGVRRKDGIRVLEMVSHQARLPGIQLPLTHEDWLDDEHIAALLAGQGRDEDPRAADTYHALTYGWLCGELLRRVDGRSIGRFFAEEVAAPLDLDVWIGLPAEREDSLARLSYAPPWELSEKWDASACDADPLLRSTWGNPPLFPAGSIPWNRPDLQRAEIPGAGGVATARSMATLYGCLASGGEVGGVRLLSERTLELGRRELVRRRDPLLEEPMSFAFGFQLQTELKKFGPPADAFGHGGAGGSIHCAWPGQRVGISYAMNVLRDADPVDPRSAALLEATYEALRASG